MTGSFVLIPGAGGMAWYWHRVAALLARAGCEAIPVDLPGEDPSAGLAEYAALVVRASGPRTNVILVPEALLRAGPAPLDEAEIVFRQSCGFRGWPALPIRVIAGADDRLFPVEFQKRVARERLQVEAEVLPGGHLISLSNPEGITERLMQYQRELMSGRS